MKDSSGGSSTNTFNHSNPALTSGSIIKPSLLHWNIWGLLHKISVWHRLCEVFTTLPLDIYHYFSCRMLGLGSPLPGRQMEWILLTDSRECKDWIKKDQCSDPILHFNYFCHQVYRRILRILSTGDRFLIRRAIAFSRDVPGIKLDLPEQGSFWVPKIRISSNSMNLD